MKSINIELFTPRPLVREEIMPTKDAFFLAIQTQISPGVVIEIVDEFFAQKNYAPSVIGSFADTYWDWFVDVVWKNLEMVNGDAVSRVISHTHTFAAAKGFDILSIYLEYLAQSQLEQVQLVSNHRQIRKFVTQIDLPLSYTCEKSMSVQEVYAHLDRYQKEDSLARAEFLSRVHEAMFVSYEEEFHEFPGILNEYVNTFIYFAEFILQRDDVVQVAKKFLKDFDDSFFSAIPPGELLPSFVVARWMNAKLRNLDLPLIPVDMIGNSFNIFSYLREFVGDEQGRYTSEQVVSLLDSFSVGLKNERIRDVYYFNEQTNQFEWDESLLKELKLIPPDFDMSTIAK